MATDIYNRVSDAYGGSFSADGAFISFSSPLVAQGSGAGLIGEVVPGIKGPAGVGLLTQNITISYTQNIMRVHEIGTNFHFFVSGRTQGTSGCQRILGPRPVSIAFYKTFGDVCNVANNIINLYMATGCAAKGVTPSGEFRKLGASFDLTMQFCVINSLGIGMNVQDSMINESLGMMFCSLLLAGTKVDALNAAASLASAAAAGLPSVTPVTPTVAETLTGTFLDGFNRPIPSTPPTVRSPFTLDDDKIGDSTPRVTVSEVYDSFGAKVEDGISRLVYLADPNSLPVSPLLPVFSQLRTIVRGVGLTPEPTPTSDPFGNPLV